MYVSQTNVKFQKVDHFLENHIDHPEAPTVIAPKLYSGQYSIENECMVTFVKRIEQPGMEGGLR